VRYEIASKSIATEGSDYLYQCLIGFMTEKGSAVVNAFYLTPEFDVIPQPGTGNTAEVEYVHFLSETEFGAPIRFGKQNDPIFPKTGYIYNVQFRSKKKLEKFKLQIVLDTTLDPMKQGVFASAFHGPYSYRLYGEAIIDFSNLDRQEGQFKPYYF